MHRWDDIKHKYCPHGYYTASLMRGSQWCAACEGAAVVFGIIALGTWAAERDRSHRVQASIAQSLQDNAETYRRLAESGD